MKLIEINILKRVRMHSRFNQTKFRLRIAAQCFEKIK